MDNKDNPPRFTVRHMAKELSGKADLKVFNHNGRIINAILGEHFSRKAGNLFTEVITPQVQDPTKWLLLIEGLHRPIHEIQIAQKFAREKQIPIHDPVIPLSQPSVIDFYLDSQYGAGISRDFVVVLVASKLKNAREEEDWDRMALLMGMTKKELLQSFWAAGHEQSFEENMKTIGDRVFDGLNDASNWINLATLDYFLSQYPNRPMVASMVGRKHEDMFGAIKEKYSYKPLVSSKVQSFLTERKKLDDAIIAYNSRSGGAKGT